ncbi:MAG: 2-amino-4-hydroxy-6-hydroxymethyldihydropteridine diphosphokinase [Pelistega sp.]|nr:2-amino-4-hydroxy-6-hydroxymethyldihydropteridine diphosphokinase [Pelistega sp.]
MSWAYIGLGSNLGESKDILAQALRDLSQHLSIKLIRVSSYYRSAPVDSSGPDYINAVACLETSLSALDLLHIMQAIELEHGRERPYFNAPRTLDLDLLLFEDFISQSAELTVPHPRMHQRAFVLAPLAELLGDDYPLAQGTLAQLLTQALAQGQEIQRN